MSAVIAVLVARNREHRRELEQLHRAQMAPIYEELFNQFTGAGDNVAQQAFFKEMHRKLLLYGASPVLRAWLQWVRETEALGEIQPEDATGLLLWERVLFAIRADLGHDNDGLEAGDLLRVYVNDVDASVSATLADPSAAARFKR